MNAHIWMFGDTPGEGFDRAAIIRAIEEHPQEAFHIRATPGHDPIFVRQCAQAAREAGAKQIIVDGVPGIAGDVAAFVSPGLPRCPA